MSEEVIKAKGRIHYEIATCVCYLADAVLNQRPMIALVTSPLMGAWGTERNSFCTFDSWPIRGVAEDQRTMECGRIAWVL